MHVPGWHAATLDLQRGGRLRMAGIIQEQHPDRARLFMQWQQMDWPIMVDSFNLLDIAVVPVTLAIDEHGIVRHINLDRDTIEETFVRQSYRKPDNAPSWRTAPPDVDALRAATERADADAWRAHMTTLGVWGSARISEVIAAGERALALEPGHGPTHFYLGVAYRKRFDSGQRQPGDFQKAVENWGAALAIDPNQYIWRRRIQQYGPRLDKPYPFYDWVPQARAAIAARGETPHPLRVEPGGAEFALPSQQFEARANNMTEPDAAGRIDRDPGALIAIETTVVPDVVAPGAAARVHIDLRPNAARGAHWNNEVDDLAVWVQPPAGWRADASVVTTPNPPGVAVSAEARRVEFELRAPDDAAPGAVSLPAYALYYVCEDVDGTCLYRRQDHTISIRIGQR